MSLYVYISSADIRDTVAEYIMGRRKTDSGFDLISPQQTLDFTNSQFNALVSTKTYVATLDASGNPAPCMMISRSSTSKTPLRLANQIGLIDMGYRGELFARVDCINTEVQEYNVAHGQRLFQIVQHNWLPWNSIVLVQTLEDLPAAPDDRGVGGFGSTGK